MGTPAANVDLILKYWDTSFANRSNAFYRENQGPQLLWSAAMAMKELIAQCANNPYVRQTVWAQSPIFSRALTIEPNGYTDWLLENRSKLGLNAIQSSAAQGMFSQFGNDPPRLLMLDGIHKAATGGFFDAADPSGIASWLQASFLGSSLGGAAIATAIENDSNAYVRVAALRIVRDMAIPVSWLDVLLGAPSAVAGGDRAQDGALFKLRSYIPLSGWPWATRVALSGVLDGAISRCLQIIKDQATNQAYAAAYEMPGGGSLPMTPQPPKQWYKRGELLSAGVLGIATGAAVAHNRKTTS